MSTPVPGWYSDPAGSGRLRWWSGTEWTEQFQDAPATAAPSAEPLATGAVPQPVDSAAAPSAQPPVAGAVPQQAHGAAGPSAQPEPVGAATAADGAGSPRPAPSKGMLIACIAAWAVAVVLCVAMTISLGAFNKAGRAVEESQQGVADAQQAVDDANSLGLSPNGDSE